MHRFDKTARKSFRAPARQMAVSKGTTSLNSNQLETTSDRSSTGNMKKLTMFACGYKIVVKSMPRRDNFGPFNVQAEGGERENGNFV